MMARWKIQPLKLVILDDFGFHSFEKKQCNALFPGWRWIVRKRWMLSRMVWCQRFLRACKRQTFGLDESDQWLNCTAGCNVWNLKQEQNIGLIRVLLRFLFSALVKNPHAGRPNQFDPSFLLQDLCRRVFWFICWIQSLSGTSSMYGTSTGCWYLLVSAGLEVDGDAALKAPLMWERWRLTNPRSDKPRCENLKQPKFLDETLNSCELVEGSCGHRARQGFCCWSWHQGVGIFYGL